MLDKKIQEYSKKLEKLGIEHEFIKHPPMVDVSEVYSFLKISPDNGFSTLLLQADGKYVVIIRRDDCELDFNKARKELRIKTLKVATEEEFVRFTGMVVGEAHVLFREVETYLDKKLFEKTYLLGGSGSNSYSCRYKAVDLKKIPKSKVIDVAKMSKKGDFLAGKRKRIVSGITPSGDGNLHIANYLGAVRQFNEIAKKHECFLFIADYHALTTVQDKATFQKNVENLILNELSLFDNLENIIFYRQSDIQIHTELQTILNNVTPLGLLKRAHAYKDKLQKNISEDQINLGLFNYPILMAADILMYNANLVPVGKDQKQHVEITRDLAERFNKIYKKDIFTLPEAYIPEKVAVILGTDGKRKMSKSLGNYIGIFEPEEIIKKQVMSCFTDPTRKHASDPGHIEGNMVFVYLDFFGDSTSPRSGGATLGASKVAELKDLYRKGEVGDVEVKNYLFESLMKFFDPARKRYEDYSKNPEKVKKILEKGAEKARQEAEKTMKQVRDVIGLSNKYSFFRY